MVQTKYNSKIYDAANEKTLFLYSHLRANAISPLQIKAGERVLVMEPDSIALMEYLLEIQTILTAVDMPEKLQREALDTGLIEAGLKTSGKQLKGVGFEITSFHDLTGSFDTVIMMGQQSHTPMAVKKYLTEGGRLALVFSSAQMKVEYMRELLAAAGFLQVEEFILTPDYKYTTEIFSSDYKKKAEGDFLIIAS